MKSSRTLWGFWARKPFKLLLSREGRGCRYKGGAAKKQQCSLGVGSSLHPRDTQNGIFEVFLIFFFNRTIKPVDPKGNQSWIFTERTDALAETPNTLASWFEELTHWKRPWRWERLKVRGEGDDRGWDGWMESLTQNGHEFEQALGVSVGQGGLACCGPWGRKD